MVQEPAGLGLPSVTVDAIGLSTFDERTVLQVTVITDDNGHYRLDLLPGVYSVRFSLPGFGTVIHEGIGIADDCRASLDARLVPTVLQEGVAAFGVHRDAARSSMAHRLPPARRGMRSHRPDPPGATPLVEQAPRSDLSRASIERQLFSKQIENACLGFVPLWLSHLEVALKDRPCQVAWVRSASAGRLS